MMYIGGTKIRKKCNCTCFFNFKLQPILIGKVALVSLKTVPFKDWLVGCVGFSGPLIQYFSLYRAVSQREGERGDKG